MQMKMNKWAMMMICFCGLGLSRGTAQSENNVVKLGISGLTGLEIQLEYERLIKRNLSVQVEVLGGIPHAIPRPFTDPFMAMGSGSRYNIYEWSKNSKFAFGIFPELRLYPLRQNALRGFYVAPYLKGKFNFYNTKGLYDSHHMNGATATIKGTVITIGGGLGIGYQLIFGKKKGFSLDFGLGVGFDYHLMNINASTDYAAERMEDWRDILTPAFTGIPVYGKVLDVELAGTKVTAKGNMPFIGVRPVLSLGYAFH